MGKWWRYVASLKQRSRCCLGHRDTPKASKVVTGMAQPHKSWQLLNLYSKLTAKHQTPGALAHLMSSARPTNDS